jgi:hypothetical protein
VVGHRPDGSPIKRTVSHRALQPQAGVGVVISLKAAVAGLLERCGTTAGE